MSLTSHVCPKICLLFLVGERRSVKTMKTIYVVGLLPLYPSRSQEVERGTKYIKNSFQGWVTKEIRHINGN